MSMKFKVGDKVRIIGKSKRYQLYRGKVQTVIIVHRGSRYPYSLNLPIGYSCFSARELEKVESEKQAD